MNRVQAEQIVSAGVWAPSADNRHHFRVRIQPGALDLMADDDLLAMKERHRRALTWFSLGAVVENMALRAAQLGLGANVLWHPAAGSPRHVARLEFAGMGATTRADDTPLWNAIESRQTNRKMYRGPGPDGSQRQALAAEVANAGSPSLHWLDGSQRKAALRLIWLAESERFQRKRLHEELFGAVRFDVGWKANADEALPPVALEVEAPMRPMFAAMRHWKLMHALTWIGAHRMLGLRAGWLPCWQAPALGVIKIPAADDQAFVAAGRGFQRMWLRATALGYSLQPAAASAVLALQSDADQGISTSARTSLLEGWDSLFPGRVAAMVFRIGHADAPSGRALRLPLQRYLEPD